MGEFLIKGVFLESDGSHTPFAVKHAFKADEITSQQAVLVVAQNHANGRLVGKVTWERVDAAS